jgi:hypothetical protein
MLAITAISAFNTVGIVGAGFCIKSILYASAKTMGLIKNVYQYDESYSELTNFLIKTDIKQKIVKTHKLLCEFEHVKIKDSVKLSLMDLNQTIYNINELLEDSLFIKVKHEELYLNRWRSLDLTDTIEKLKIQTDLFKIRFQDLVDIMTIVNKL